MIEGDLWGKREQESVRDHRAGRTADAWADPRGHDGFDDPWRPPRYQFGRPIARDDAVQDRRVHLIAELDERIAGVEQAIEAARRAPSPGAGWPGPDATTPWGTARDRAEAAAAALSKADLDWRVARVGQAIEMATHPSVSAPRWTGSDGPPWPGIERARAEARTAALLYAELGDSMARVGEAVETARRASVSDARWSPSDAAPRSGTLLGRAEDNAAVPLRAELGAIRMAFEQVASRLAAIETITSIAAPALAQLVAGPHEVGRRPDVDADTAMPSGFRDAIRGRQPGGRARPAGLGRASAPLGTSAPRGDAADARQAAWTAADAATLSAAQNPARMPHGHAAADADVVWDFAKQVPRARPLRLAHTRPILAGLALFVAGAVATMVLGSHDHAGVRVAQTSETRDHDPVVGAGPIEAHAVDGPDAAASANPGDVAAPVGAGSPTVDLEATGSTPQIETATTEDRAIVPPALERSAESGEAGAEVELASTYAKGTAKDDLAAAAYWYERAARQGHADAQYRLGFIHENGVGVPRNRGKALHWYRQAAKAGNPLAMNALGLLALADSPPDNVQAAAWFRSAADRDVQESQYHLGLLLADGLGTPKSLTQAYRWLDIAARAGQSDAENARDEVAERLDARELAVARAASASFRPKPIGSPAARKASGDANPARPQAAGPLRPPNS